MSLSYINNRRRKVDYHLRNGDDLGNEIKVLNDNVLFVYMIQVRGVRTEI